MDECRLTLVDIHDWAQERFSVWSNKVSSAIYFITITLKPDLYKYSSITQYEMTVNAVKEILAKYNNYYVMVAEHTADANIHYHAMIVPRDRYANIALINKLKKGRLFGFIKQNSEPVIERQRTFNYLKKELFYTQKTLSTPHYKPEVLVFY